MSWETMTVEVAGPVAQVWLDRPKARNALNQRMLEELAAAFEWLERQYDVRVVILGGHGPTFCAGADRKDAPGVARMTAASASVRERHWLARLGNRALDAIERLDAVTIARIHGHAIGGGVLLALACDFRIAAEGTVFFFPEVELASPLDWRGIPRMAREIGLARAREMVLMGERVDAVRAERFGLLNRVVPADQLDAAVLDWAQRVVERPELAVHMGKTQFRAYAATIPIGDASQFEPTLLLEALKDDRAKANFGVSVPRGE